ncbi:hypothetical protein L202_02058 [Cryptococcus amylolentus CBS 6039]|uniref:FCP1 homology domain-containing protein n=2 Tax=Cryptococcus amylolentus TaxID=104669 RepID=A0A1E3HZC4_9TREE|nr:hypothetical protein L202_02058 [Cryptococcus amylolentus CBS 6039]ODN81659.1 hypothetical protein L202_02058 [Cryptococcus amylolentus CBS 6039]ODO10134.1 hypothetical protein I350_02362 [Cryptococcus amylolentus CBS 6273]
MNTLSRLDTWLSALFTPPPPKKVSSKQASPVPSLSASPSRQSASRSSSSLPAQTLPSTPLGRPSTPTQSRARRTPKRRRRRQTYSSLKVPPPTTPLIIRIALVLWSILLSFWRSFVGETRATRGRGRRRVRGRDSRGGLGGAVSVSAGLEGLRELGERVLVNAGISPSEEENDHGEEGSEGEGWVDPVTRGPEGAESMEEVPPGEDEFAATVSGEALQLDLGADEETIRAAGPDPNFTFRLRSAPQRNNEDGVSSGRTTPSRKPIPFQRPPSPTSILENPISPSPVSQLRITPPEPDEKPVQPAPRRASGGKLLANPISTSLLDPSVPAPASNAESTLFRKPSPRLPKAIPTTPFHLQKTLILDLDETLIHSTSRPLNYPGGSSGGGGILGLSLGGVLGIGAKGRGREGHTVEVVVNGRSTMYHVYKRPYVDHFLRKVAAWYTLVIYTASMPEYADPVIDWLDGGRNLFAKKLYRESCFQQPNGSYVKDLALVEKDLSRVCFMDNSPISYTNALPIEGWTSDPNDEALLHSIPVLDSLRFVNDVRRVLGIRGFT